MEGKRAVPAAQKQVLAVGGGVGEQTKKKQLKTRVVTAQK